MNALPYTMSGQNSLLTRILLISLFSIILLNENTAQTWEKINEIDGRVFSMYQNDDIAYVCVWNDLYVGDQFSAEMTKVLDGVTWRVMKEYQGVLYLGGNGQFAHSHFVTTPLDRYEPMHECSPPGSTQISVLDFEIYNGLFFFGTINRGVQFRLQNDCDFMDISPPNLKGEADNSALHFTEDGGLILGTFNGDLYFKPELENWQTLGGGFGPIHDIEEFNGNYYMGATRFRVSDGENLLQWSTVAAERAGDIEIFQDEIFVARRSGLFSSPDGQNWMQHTDGLGEVDNDAILFKQGTTLFLGAADGSIYQLKTDTDTDTKEEALTPQVILSPNPAQDRLYITSQEFHFTQYAVFDIQGRLIMEGQLAADTQCTLNLRTVSTGMYTVQLKAGDRVYVEKFVVR